MNKFFVTVFFSVLLSNSPAEAFELKDLLGTYYGVGQSNAYGARKVVFTLAEFSNGEGAPLVMAGFRWSDQCGDFDLLPAIYYSAVKYNKESKTLYMRIEFPARREHGIIVNELTIKVADDGTLHGAYRTSSMTALGELMQGNWTAKKQPLHVVPFTPGRLCRR